MNLLIFALAALLPTSSRADDAYDVLLTLSRGGEVRTFNSHVRLSEAHHTVVKTSGPWNDSLIVSLLPTRGDGAGRIDLQYNVGWASNGLSLQIQDTAVVSEREDALLTELSGQWALRAKVSRASGGETCVPPSSGGGLVVRLRGKTDGVEFDLTRRTNYGMQSNVYSEDAPDRAFSAGLLVVPSEPDVAVVHYRATTKSHTDAGYKSLSKQLRVQEGVETKAEDEDLWVTYLRAPQSDPPPAAVPEVPDSRTGWLRHAGRNISFLHPKRWEVSQGCDAEYNPHFWMIIDTSLPVNDPRGHNQRDHLLKAFIVKEKQAPLEQRTPLWGGAGKGFAPGLIAVGGGTCRLTAPDSNIAQAMCQSADGRQLELNLPLEPKGAGRYGDFRRLVESLRFERTN